MTGYKPITGELRKYATVSWDPWPDARDRLYQMCDRIDAIHAGLERENAELKAELDRTRGELDYWESTHVELPKDANGEYIHIGDRVENNERVVRIVLTDDSWEPSVYIEKLPNVLHEYFCNEIGHYHAPTVEDLLLDMHRRLNDVSELYEVDSDELEDEYTRIIEECAAKVREALGE